MKRVVFLTAHGTDPDETLAIQQSFTCLGSRLLVQTGDLVVARYCALPWYKELEQDILYAGGTLINSYRQHRYVADLGNWVADLEGLTPETWNRLEDIPDEGPFIVKGETNSKKFLWDTHCFAATKRDAIDVWCRLQDDGLISGQHVYVRRFVPLHTYMTGFRGMPVTKEFRVFVCDSQVLSAGYYWSNYADDLPVTPDPSEIPSAFLQEVLGRVGRNVRFYTVDVAQTQEGEWLVIELNDGQMAGLSMNPPEQLYGELAHVLG